MGKIIALTVLMLSAASSHAALTVRSGTCKLESSGEVLTLVNVDPNHHFGLFAEAISKEGFRIYLTQNFHNSVDLNMNTTDNMIYAIVPLATAGETSVKAGMSVSRAAGKPGEWLSCDLRVGKVID